MKQVPIYILIGIVICLFTCNNSNTHSIEERIVTSVIHDTLITTYTITDTLVQYDTTIFVRDTIICDTVSVQEYVYDINDSLITGQIIVQGISNPNLKYTLTTKAFHTTKHTEIIEKNLRGFLYGGQITVEPIMSQFEINIAYQNKQGNIFKLGGGFDFYNSNPIITIGYLKRF